MCFLPTRWCCHYSPWSVRARSSLFVAYQTITFLGRKYRATFKGEVRTHWRRREPGVAVKHWVKSNAIKMYDSRAGCRGSRSDERSKRLLRAPTRLKNDGSKVVGWFEMNKGVANMYRYGGLASGSHRYLEGLAVVNDVGVGQRELD